MNNPLPDLKHTFLSSRKAFNAYRRARTGLLIVANIWAWKRFAHESALFFKSKISLGSSVLAYNFNMMDKQSERLEISLHDFDSA